MNRRLFLIFHGRLPSEKAAALFATESAGAFQKEGCAVTVVVPRRLGRLGTEAGAVYLPTLDLFSILSHPLAFRLSLFSFSVSSYLYLFFHARQSDLVYSNESLPLFFSTLSFARTVYELHDYPERFRFFYRALLARVSGIVVTNEIKRKRLAVEYPRTQGKTLVEANAVSLAQFSISTSRDEARKILHLPGHAKIVVYTGHLYSWKGVDTLAQAAEQISDTQVYIVGGTDIDIAKYKREWVAEQNLHFVGHRPHTEMPLWQKAADVLVIPNTAREKISVESTSPMKLFEYMASGTPIVASRLPSIVEVVGESSYFFEPDNANDLARVITEVLKDSNVAARTVAARTAVAEHTWEKRAKRILAWLGTLPDVRERYYHERIIFFASLAVTALFIATFIVSGQALPPLSHIDSDGYIPAAITLYEHGALEEVSHTPGYPFFLAVTAVPWGSVIPSLIIQALLLAFSAVLLYRLLAGVCTPTVRFVGALVYGIEPFTAYITAQPLSEALFLFLFICSLSIIRKAFESNRRTFLLWSGVLLGLSALVRPIILYAVPIIVIAVLAFWRYERKNIFKATLAFVSGLVLILLPFAYRNHDLYGVWAISNKGPFTLYFYDAGELVRYRDHLSHEEANQLLIMRAQKVYPAVKTQNDMLLPSYGLFLMQESLAIIRESPLLYVKIHALALGTFFLSDGYRLLWYEITDGGISLPNITYAIAEGDTGAVNSYFKENPGQAIAFALGFLFWVGALLLALVGFVRGVFGGDTKKRVVVLAFGTVIVYFALMTGLESQARYRIVVTPFLFMLASYGAATLATYLYAHRRLA